MRDSELILAETDFAKDFDLRRQLDGWLRQMLPLCSWFQTCVETRHGNQFPLEIDPICANRGTLGSYGSTILFCCQVGRAGQSRPLRKGLKASSCPQSVEGLGHYTGPIGAPVPTVHAAQTDFISDRIQQQFLASLYQAVLPDKTAHAWIQRP
jgi:hypothetical protein